MPDISVDQLGDLLRMTLPELNRDRYTQIATDLQDYVFSNYFLKQGEAKDVIKSGTKVQWRVVTQVPQNSRNVGFAEHDVVNINDTVVLAEVEWRMSVSAFAIIGNEIAMNRGASQILNLIKQRQMQCDLADAILMEGNFAGPPVSPTDKLTPWGFPTWIQKNAVTGFNGGNPPGYTSIGLDANAYPNWRNYTALYTAMTDSDLYAKWRRAALEVNFKPVISTRGEASAGKEFLGDKYIYLTTLPVYLNTSEMLRAQNENLGTELNKYSEEALFNGVRVKWVPYLDADTTNPVYGINMSTFKLATLDGWWNKPTVVAPYPGQHTVAATFYDKQYQFICYNRRQNFVLATGVSYPY